MKILRLLTCLILFVACAVSAPQRDNSAQLAMNDMYQKGIQARMNKNPEECLRIFQNIIELRKNAQGSLYLYSLYQSGLCYEMKNEADKAIAVYQDALNAANTRAATIVPSIFYELEVPSRLAICYAKLGDSQVAEQYYDKSKTYLGTLEKNKKELNENRKHYAEILYEIGLITGEFHLGSDFSAYEKSIEYAQEYLTLAMELGVEPYSKYAAQQLLDHFQNTYNYIAQLKPEATKEDPIVAARQNQEIKKHLSEELLVHFDQFREFIKTKRQFKDNEYQPLLVELGDLQQKLEAIMQERPIGEGLTPEAQKLQNPKKSGMFAPVRGEKEK